MKSILDTGMLLKLKKKPSSEGTLYYSPSVYINVQEGHMNVKQQNGAKTHWWKSCLFKTQNDD